MARPWPWCDDAVVSAARDVITAQLAYGLGRRDRKVEVPPETIRVLCEQIVDGWAVVYLEFEDSEGRLWDAVAQATYDEAQQCWRPAGAAYGGRAPSEDPAHPGCLFHLQSLSWNPLVDRCCIGLRVYDPTGHRVTVLDDQGRQTTGEVDDGVALLLSEGPVGEPKTIELYDINGHLLQSRRYDGSD